MTAYTAVATGNWDNPATWGVATYPNALADTANLAGFTVSIVAVTVSCGYVAANGGILLVDAGGTLILGNTSTPALLVDATGTLRMYGRIQGQESGSLSRIQLASGATFTSPTLSHTLRRIMFMHSTSHSVSTIFGATTEADEVTCQLYAYLGTLTVDVSCACYGMTAEWGLLIFNAGVTVKMASYTYLNTAAAGIIKVNGTKAAPVVLQPYSAGNRFYLRLRGNPYSYIDWLTFSGLHNSTLYDYDGLNYISFARSPTYATPVNRPPIIDTDPILGRISRTHYRGNEPALVEVSGVWNVADKQYDAVDAMMRAGAVVGFVDEGSQVAIPNARIVFHDYVREKGKLYWPYTITLQEVRD